MQPYAIEEEDGFASPIELSIDPEEQSDPFHRYMVPQLVVSFRGKFSVLRNLDDVAFALRVPAEYVAQYLALSQNAVARQDKKHGGHWTLSPTNGDVKKLSAGLVSFIKTFVLCKGCGLPELHYSESVASSDAASASDGSAPATSAASGRGKPGKARDKPGKKKGQVVNGKVKSAVEMRCQSCRWSCRVQDLVNSSSGSRNSKADHVSKMVDYIGYHPPPPTPNLLGASSNSASGSRMLGGISLGGSGLMMMSPSNGITNFVLG